jgi:hypothetical protein
MNTETLKDYRLTLDDWLALAAVGNGVLTPKPIHVEMLVLAGLVKRDRDQLCLTDEGVEAYASIDTIFDWHEFAFPESPESPSEALAEAETVELPAKPAERPERLTVGSLVRHVPTGGVGLITKHTMYDANWGGFYVDFVKPVDNVINGRAVNQLSKMFDRADKFERV